MHCLLAAVALQKIHWVDGNCVAANTVVVVLHGDLLKSVFGTGNWIGTNFGPHVNPYYITGMTPVSFPYM